jgi:hypothetical protein
MPVFTEGEIYLKVCILKFTCINVFQVIHVYNRAQIIDDAFSLYKYVFEIFVFVQTYLH